MILKIKSMISCSLFNSLLVEPITNSGKTESIINSDKQVLKMLT